MFQPVKTPAINYKAINDYLKHFTWDQYLIGFYTLYIIFSQIYPLLTSPNKFNFNNILLIQTISTFLYVILRLWLHLNLILRKKWAYFVKIYSLSITIITYAIQFVIGTQIFSYTLLLNLSLLLVLIITHRRYTPLTLASITSRPRHYFVVFANYFLIFFIYTYIFTPLVIIFLLTNSHFPQHTIFTQIKLVTITLASTAIISWFITLIPRSLIHFNRQNKKISYSLTTILLTITIFLPTLQSFLQAAASTKPNCIIPIFIGITKVNNSDQISFSLHNSCSASTQLNQLTLDTYLHPLLWIPVMPSRHITTDLQVLPNQQLHSHSSINLSPLEPNPFFYYRLTVITSTSPNN